MKSRYVNMFMMTVTLAYSAPIEYEYDTVYVVTPSKPNLREADDTPGKCCSDPSKGCCPYDYDDRCETTNNRTLCGYNKNRKKPDGNKVFFTKFGLPCRINDDRVECGYNGPYITGVTDPLPNTPAGNPSGCCNCCNQQTTKAEITTEVTTVTFTEPATEFKPTLSDPMPTETVTETTEFVTETTEFIPETTDPIPETTEFIPEPTEFSPKTTETRTETTDSTKYPEEITKTSHKKLNLKTSKLSPRATTCVTVEEKCHIQYEDPCILDPPCQRDYDD